MTGGYSVQCATEGEGEGTSISIASHLRGCFDVLPVCQGKLLVPFLKNKRLV